MAFPEKAPAAAPAAAAPAAAAPAAVAPAAPAAAAAPDAGMAEIGAALKHMGTLLETVLARLPAAAEPAAAPAAPAAAAAAPGAEDANPDAPDGPGPDLTLEPVVKTEGEGGDNPGELDADGNPVLPAANQEGTPARGSPTPHGAMDAKGVQAVVAAAVKAERTRAAAVQEARRSVQGVLGDVAMDDAGAIYREALSQSGVDVSQIGKGAERVAWDAYKVAAGAAAGVRRVPAAVHAADGKGADAAPSYMKHLDNISVRG